MAVTKIWKVKGNAGSAISYADDPEKVIGEMFADDLDSVIKYADNGSKTEQHMYTTALNCTREFAAQEFELTKELYDKRGGIVAVHATQSFEETDLSPKEAHEIGMQLAKEMWGDNFQVIVSTHLNTDHVHNHFVINSVSFKDGRKYHLTNYRWHEMKEVSDRLCKEHGLSVIEKPQGRHKNYWFYQEEKHGKPTADNIARAALDHAIKRSLNFEEFKAELRALDFSFRFDSNRKHWTVTLPDGKKPIRIDRLGPDYSKDRIMEQIYSNDPSVRANKYREVSQYRPNNYHLKRRINKINTRTGLEKLYLKVCYEMGYLPKYKQDPLKVNYLFREELLKCDLYGKEARLLSDNHISTKEDLAKLKQTKENKIAELTSNREELRKTIKRRTVPEDQKESLREQVTELTNRVKDLRSDVNLIEDIEARSGQLKVKMKELERVRDRKEKER